MRHLSQHRLLNAATAATRLARTFTLIELQLLVGIGGGVLREKNDTRLGDVVVGASVQHERRTCMSAACAYNTEHVDGI